MKYRNFLLIFIFIFLSYIGNVTMVFGGDLSGVILDTTQTVEKVDKSDDSQKDDEDKNEVLDPLKYVFNYPSYYFNHGLQIYGLEPVAELYGNVTPEIVRVGFGNFFSNLRAPVNIVNNSLQLNFDYSGLELLRFAINLTVGVGGFYDASYYLFDIDKHEASFGQTLGYYGVGHGIYIVWPILGPSSLRETAGFAGDQLMYPPTYFGYFYLDFIQSSSAMTFDKINDTSFKLGDYKTLINACVEPYDCLKKAFEDYNVAKVNKVK